MDADQDEEPCMPAVGLDAGTVNMGIGGIKFYGLTRLEDEEGTVIKTIPRFDITGAERWDLTRGIVTRAGPDMKSLDRHIPSPPSIYSKKLPDISRHVTQCVPAAKWIFAPSRSLLDKGATTILPVLVVENQSDFVVRGAEKDAQGKQPNDFKKALMGQVANFVTTAINTIDAAKYENRYGARERLGAMSKYGIRCDASRDRPERKEDAVEAFLELLSELGTPNALAWLGWFEWMESQGEQIHDIIDALSLALQNCITRYQKHGKVEVRLMEQQMREEIKKRREMLNSIKPAAMRPKKPRKVAKKSVEAGDDDDAETGEPKKKRKTVAKKLTDKPKKARKGLKKVGTGDEDQEEGEEEKPAKKKRAPRKKATKETKKRKKGSSDEEGDDEVVLVSPVKKKQALEYPILLLDEPLVRD